MKLKILISLLFCITMTAPISAHAYIAKDNSDYYPSYSQDSFVNVPLEAKNGEDVYIDILIKNSDSVEGVVCSINAAYAYLKYVDCTSHKGYCYTNNYNFGEFMFSCFMKDGGTSMKSETKIATLKFKARKDITAKMTNIFSYKVTEFYNSSMKEIDHSNVIMKSGKTHTHTVVIDKRVEPTCQKTGLTEGKHCSECGDVIVAQEIIPMTDHKYQNGKCIYCQKEDPNYKPYTGQKIYGDVDSDGNITSGDSLLILRNSVKLEVFSSELTKLSDVDGDGNVTSSDALEVLRYSVKLPSNTKTGQPY